MQNISRCSGGEFMTLSSTGRNMAVASNSEKILRAKLKSVVICDMKGQTEACVGTQPTAAGGKGLLWPVRSLVFSVSLG